MADASPPTTDRSGYSSQSATGTASSRSVGGSGGGRRGSSSSATGPSKYSSDPSKYTSDYGSKSGQYSYEEYSATDRSATEASGTDRSYSSYGGQRSERASNQSEGAYSEYSEGGDYSDYSDYYSYSESSGPPSARPTVGLIDQTIGFLGSVDERMSRFVQRDESKRDGAPPRPERRDGPIRGRRATGLKKPRVPWQETEGLRNALEENLASIEAMLVEMDEPTRQSAQQFARTEQALRQREALAARLRTQLDDEAVARQRAVATLRAELAAEKSALERRRRGPEGTAAEKRLRAATEQVNSAATAEAKATAALRKIEEQRLSVAAVAAATPAGGGGGGGGLDLAGLGLSIGLGGGGGGDGAGAAGLADLPRMEAMLSRLATTKRVAQRRVAPEPPARLRQHLRLLEGGVALQLRTDAVGSGMAVALAPQWCVLAPGRRGTLLVHRSGLPVTGGEAPPPAELELSQCRRMSVGPPEESCVGVVKQPALRLVEPGQAQPHGLWGSAHLCFSLLAAPRDDGHRHRAAGAEELLEIHGVASSRQELHHVYLGLQALGGLPGAERLSRGGLLWRQLRLLLTAHAHFPEQVLARAAVSVAIPTPEMGRQHKKLAAWAAGSSGGGGGGAETAGGRKLARFLASI